MSPDRHAAVRSIRLKQRRRASLAARAAAEPPRQGLLALFAAVEASAGDPTALMGIDDHVDDDVVVELAHRMNRNPQTVKEQTHG